MLSNANNEWSEKRTIRLRFKNERLQLSYYRRIFVFVLTFTCLAASAISQASTYDLNPKKIISNIPQSDIANGILYKGSIYSVASDEESDYLMKFDGKKVSKILRQLPDGCFSPSPQTIFENKLLLIGYCEIARSGDFKGSVFAWNGFSAVNLANTYPEMSTMSIYGAINCGGKLYLIGEQSGIWVAGSSITRVAASRGDSFACNSSTFFYSIEGIIYSNEGSQPLISKQSGLNYLGNPISIGSKIYFQGGLAADAIDSLWSFDSSTKQLDQVSNFYTPLPIEIDGTLYSSGYNKSTGTELYSFPESGPQLERDINPGKESSTPSGLVNYQGELFFYTKDGLLWRLTNGHLYPIVDVKKLPGETNATRLRHIFVLNETLYLATSPEGSGIENYDIWSYKNSAQFIENFVTPTNLKFGENVFIPVVANSKAIASHSVSGVCTAKLANVVTTVKGKKVTTKMLKVTSGTKAGICLIDLTAPTSGKYLNLKKVVQIKVSKTGK